MCLRCWVCGRALERAATSISGPRAARALAGGAERLEPTSSRIILRLPRLSAAVLAVRLVDSVCLRCWVCGRALERAATSISGPRAARALAGGAERLEPTSSRIILRLPRLSAAVLAVRWVDRVPPAPRRSAGPARPHRLRSVRHASAGRGGAVRGGAGRSCWAIACGGGPPPRARTSCTGCTCASSCGATHGTEARACWGRRATGATPSVRGARCSSRWGRCVALGRSDGTPPPGAGAPEREGVLLVSLQGVI